MDKISQKDKNIKTNYKFTYSIDQNINVLKNIFKENETIVYREFENENNYLRFCVIFSEVMVNKEIMNFSIIRPIVGANFNGIISGNNLTEYLKKAVIINPTIKESSDLDEITNSIMYGDTLVLVDGLSIGLIIEAKGWKTRGIETPQSERTVKGPQDSFSESIETNISLLSKRVLSSDLKFVYMNIGTRTKTKVCVCYIKGIASEKILNELYSRLNKINIDGILGSNYIEEFIDDAPTSVFNTVNYTERPDVTASRLLEGRVALIIDGTPFVTTVPCVFAEFFQAADDYYNNYLFGSFSRLLRFLGFFLGLSVPALYTAVTTFHQELIPTRLALSISTSRHGVPFPTFVEALIMLLGFDMLREAGVRLPKPIGQTISIVGALVLGEAAVNARLVSAPMVIVVAVTGIASLIIPKLLGPFIIIRLIFLILASVLGLYGYTFGVFGLCIYLASLKSFGLPFLTGIGSIDPQDLKDTAVRVPWLAMKLRPIFANNPIRKGKSHERG